MRKCILLVIAPCIFMLLLTCCVPAIKNSPKLDPSLQLALNAPSSVEETTKLYPCIVYTKDTAVLHQKGIRPETVLPTFVTARLTKRQIFLLVKTPEVSYIASPKPDQLHADDR